MDQNNFRNYANGIAKFLRLVKKQNLSIQNDGTFPTSFYDQSEILHDRQIVTSEESSIYRRTLLLERDPKNSFGFSLQSIVIEKKFDGDNGKRITYISKVDDDSPADMARMVPGDVIIAIDGQIVVDLSHSELVALIKTKTRMRLIVLFEDMVKKVELITLYLKLEKKLSEKLEELLKIEEEEKRIMQTLNLQTNDENCIQESTISDDISSGFEDSSEVASNMSVKSLESWNFDESSVQCC